MAPLVARLIVVAAGALVCFCGYSTFRAMLGLTAFIVAAHALASRPQLLPRHPDWLAPVVVAAVGLLAAVLVLALWKLGVALLGAFALVLVAQAATASMPLDPVTRLVGLALVALVGAVLARLLERIVLSVATAAYGAFIIVGAFAATPLGRWWEPGAPPARRVLGETPLLVFWIVLALVGAAVQLRGKPAGKRAASAEE